MTETQQRASRNRNSARLHGVPELQEAGVLEATPLAGNVLGPWIQTRGVTARKTAA